MGRIRNPAQLVALSLRYTQEERLLLYTLDLYPVQGQAFQDFGV